MNPYRLKNELTYWARRMMGVGNPVRAPSRWDIKPGDLTGENVCLFVTYSPAGSVSEAALFQARAWAAEGFSVIMVVVVNDIGSLATQRNLGFCRGVLIRANVGYDFGAWAAAIRSVRSIRMANALVIANDSNYGPLSGFDSIVNRIKCSAADVVGLIESRQSRRHFQSFLIAFKSGALRNRIFRKFWWSVVNGNRQWVIDRYEMTLIEKFEGVGLSSEVLFPAPPQDDRNRTLAAWRELIDAGFPFIKAQLLRDNPHETDISNWQEVVESKGFDPALIHEHLATGRRAADQPNISPPQIPAGGT